MCKLIKSIFVLAFFSGVSCIARASDNIPDFASGVIKVVESEASTCGVRFVPARPGTPTPADYLAINSSGTVIAHILNRGNYFSVSRPLGGNVHWIEYSMDWLGFYTPGGTVAHANRFTTGGDWQYNYYCRSVPVNASQFDACVAQGFVNVLVERLCRAY